MDGWLTIGTKLDDSMINKQIKLLKDKLEGLEEEYEILEKTDPFEGQNKELIKLGNEIDATRKKITKLQNQQKISLEGIGTGITKVIKKVARWGLAIFGIRSAYLAIRSAMSTLTQYDDQLKSDVDYIKNALAFALEPVIRRIVDLAKQLLLYIGYLIKSWTGYDIFANANKNLKKATGSAKELKKQLAGFDEMNVLQDTSGGGGGGASTQMSLEGFEPPKWLETIEKAGKWILDNWEDVVGVLLLTKLFIDILTGNWLGVIIDLVLLLIDLFFKAKDAIQVIAENWKEAFKVVADFMMDKVIKPIGEWFAKLWQKIKDGVNNAVQSVKDKFNSIKDFFKNIVSTIVGFFKTIGTKVGDAIGGAFKAVINGVLKAIENILNFPINQINKLLKVINKVPGVNISTLPTFNLPRLARGGIVHNPGNGVFMGSYVAGEGRSPEAVIPLDDATLDRLGEAFARHTTLNATVPVYVGNRMVVREMKRISAEDNFAYNR